MNSTTLNTQETLVNTILPTLNNQLETPTLDDNQRDDWLKKNETLENARMRLNADPYGSFLYEIDNEIKLVRNVSQRYMVKLHEEIYPDDRFEKRYRMVERCKNENTVYDDIINQLFNENGFLKDTNMDIEKFSENLRKITDGYSYFKYKGINKKEFSGKHCVGIDDGIKKRDGTGRIIPDVPKGVWKFTGVPKDEDEIKEVGGFFPVLTDKSVGGKEPELGKEKDVLCYEENKTIDKESFISLGRELACGNKIDNDNMLAMDVSTSSKYFNLTPDIFPNEVSLNKSTEYNLYYNKQFNIGIVLDSGILSQMDNSMYFQELIKVQAVSINDVKDINKIKNKLSTRDFDSLDEFEKYVDEYIIKSKLTTEDIKDKINQIYKITDKIENKMKFMDIYDDIIECMKLEENNKNLLRRKLPNIFLEMGLKKKRYNDGIYYYGLIRKEIKVEKDTDEPLNREYGLNIIDVNKSSDVEDEFELIDMNNNNKIKEI